MDMLMDTQSLSSGFPSDWDFYLDNGLSVVLDYDQERNQLAAIAAYIELGSIPGIEQTGIPWPEFMTGDIEARALDAEIRLSIKTATSAMLNVPYYYELNGRLQLIIQEYKDGSSI